MNITNLTEPNVEEIEELIGDMQNENPDIAYEVFKMPSPEEILSKSKSEAELLKMILSKIESLERKFEHVFGGHVLIDGQWECITKL